ncbi:MAG TPA: hypothetical protein VFI24_22195 [Pyrinomonadaceae bacterium]|nr:hypothetical protein [Pyrinomonadaceae bacterium]
MNLWSNKMQAWRDRRQQRSLEWWGKVRARGKSRFVIESAMAYSFTIVGLADVYNQIFHGSHEVSVLTISYYLCTGLLLGMFGWSHQKKKYEKALTEARTKALPGVGLPPHN